MSGLFLRIPKDRHNISPPHLDTKHNIRRDSILSTTTRGGSRVMLWVYNPMAILWNSLTFSPKPATWDGSKEIKPGQSQTFYPTLSAGDQTAPRNQARSCAVQRHRLCQCKYIPQHPTNTWETLFWHSTAKTFAQIPTFLSSRPAARARVIRPLATSKNCRPTSAPSSTNHPAIAKRSIISPLLAWLSSTPSTRRQRVKSHCRMEPETHSRMVVTRLWRYSSRAFTLPRPSRSLLGKMLVWLLQLELPKRPVPGRKLVQLERELRRRAMLLESLVLPVWGGLEGLLFCCLGACGKDVAMKA